MKVFGKKRRPTKASSTQDDGTPRSKPKRKVSTSTIVMSIILVVGLAVMAYPSFSDWWNSFHQSQAIASYSEAVEKTDPKQIEAMLQAAHEYNDRLAANPGRFSAMSPEERAEYESLLNLEGNGIIGVINIPIIGVNLPVYHGVEESVLQVAIGHIEASSLPVGGPSTHTVVSGHRGLPSAKLFTDLDKLKEGDVFTFTVLNQKITYEIDQIHIVEPTDMSDLEIVEGEDLATLITCTPYGINTHRMLVRGHRVENESVSVVVPATAVQIPNYMAIIAVAIPILFVYLLGTLIYYRFRRPELDTQKALDVVREQAMGKADVKGETGKDKHGTNNGDE